VRQPPVNDLPVFQSPTNRSFRGIYVLTRVALFIGLLGVAPLLHSQTAPTAERVGDLKIGGAFSTANSDYGDRYNGGAAYFDFDFLRHIGVEGQFHFVKDPDDLYEKTYEVGPRYYRTYRKFVPYAKAMYGRGVFNYPALADGFRPNLAYNIAAAGVGVDYKVRPYLYVRADWEYQVWFGFQGSSLTPSILTLGAAYHFR
jgi:hypothetical protein